MSTESFTPYQSSRGEVIDHQAEPPAYIVRDTLGQVIGIPANGIPSPENVEADIANPPQPIASAADIAAHRWAVENGGIAVEVSTGTHLFDTRREMEARWLKLQLAAANPSFTQNWKTLDHGFVTLTAADVLAVTAAVEAHVTACFAAEGTLLANPPTLGNLPTAFSALMP